MQFRICLSLSRILGLVTSTRSIYFPNLRLTSFNSYTWPAPAPPASLYVRIRNSSMRDTHVVAMTDTIVLDTKWEYYHNNPPRPSHPVPPKICGPLCGLLHREKDKDGIYIFLWKRVNGLNSRISTKWHLVCVLCRLFLNLLLTDFPLVPYHP